MINSFSRMKRSRILKNYVVIFVFIFVVFTQILFAVEPKEEVGITFTFANGEITGGGTNGYYEFDVMVNASATGTKIGTGIVYINYNTSGFGENIYGSGNVDVTNGTLTSNPGPPLYLLLLNDNASSRFAVTFEYTSAAGWGNDLPTAPIDLIHVKIVIADPSETSGLSFENILMIDCQYYDDNTTTYDPVIAIDTDNSSLPVSNAYIAISKYGLLQNTPNPFGRTNSSTEISFIIDKDALAEVKIYNIRGQLVRNLFIGIVNKDEELNLIWNGKDDEGNILPSGIYFYQLSTIGGSASGGNVDKKLYQTKKLLLIR